MKKIPSSLYRLQLTESLNFKEAKKLLPYIKELGFEGVYTSPFFAAHSSHGYDIVDPNRINPLLGTERDFAAFCDRIHSLGLLHIADVVPNHMGIYEENPWFSDVMEKGPHSKYADFFDIDWSLGYFLLPVLGEGESAPPNDYYMKVPWTNAAYEATYRRFFNINQLIGIRIEDEKVLKAHHKLIFQLLREGKVDGLRVDHPDGLYDPKTYFDRIRKKHKGLVVVEKILGWQEELPQAWKVDGSVGYEYMNMLTGLFVKQSERLTQVYEQFIGETQDFDARLYANKRLYMKKEMAGDVFQLANHLSFAPFKKMELIDALYELLARFPVYRSYIRPSGKVPKADIPYIEEAFKKAKGDKKIFQYLKKLFFLEIDTKASREFLIRFQQLSAPIMAKGFEDITLYNYNRLLALNDVGSEPVRGGVSVEEFHAFCKRKQEKWPFGFLATSTHDTKRSHDVRMQLAVLSEIPEKWEKALQLFSSLNGGEKTQVGAHLYPDKNAEYFFYQILLGAWPSDPSANRMWASFQKSIREARAHTSWNEPDELYEEAAEHFVYRVMRQGSPFMTAMGAFYDEVAEYGKWNSLSSLALKLGGPGIVETYQGCENWRYTLVDPDNRSRVNFSQKETIKSALHKRALNFRKEHKALFLEGKYTPLKVLGAKKEHVVAFLRTHKNEACLVAGARFFADLKEWKGTTIHLPKSFGEGVQIFTEEPFDGKEISVDSLFSQAPFAWVYFPSAAKSQPRRSKQK